MQGTTVMIPLMCPMWLSGGLTAGQVGQVDQQERPRLERHENYPKQLFNLQGGPLGTFDFIT